jgi:hypothetical protein
MTAEQQEELIEAIRSDEIDNATQYAADFAARHGLNPKTVRSAISRLRRDLGLLKRRPRRISKAQALVDSGIAHDLADAWAQLRDMDETPQPFVRRTPGGERGAEGWLPPVEPITVMDILNRGIGISPELARVGAAVLLRYGDDEDFRRAVDERRTEIELLSRRVADQVALILQATTDLTREETNEFLRLLNERIDAERSNG